MRTLTTRSGVLPTANASGTGALSAIRPSRPVTPPIRRSLIITVLLFQLAAVAGAAPQAELWPRWEAYTAGSDRTVDHDAWAAFLDRYLVTDAPDGVHRVRYGSVTAEDRRALQQYIGMLESVPVSDLDRPEQLAFWTNLYNAVTVELILEHYPVDSIRDINISGPMFNRHPWDAELTEAEGVALTLNEIEHRIMRPIWQDPRIHYVVNCASIGCPNLLEEPFTAENWDTLADRAAREYVNHPRGVDFSGRRPFLSSIYDWYEVDFGDDIAGVIDHVLQYADGERAAQVRAFADGGYRGRVRYDYDWALNEQ